MLILDLYSRVYTFFERCTGDFSEGGMCRQNVVQKWGIIGSLCFFGALGHWGAGRGGGWGRVDVDYLNMGSMGGH